MKKFLITLAIFLSVLVLWALIGMKKRDISNFLSPTVLDIASPSDVNIDVEFIKGLDPAYGR